MSVEPVIRLEIDGTVSVLIGKSEIGQGIYTSIAQIAAEELDVSFSRMRVVSPDTNHAPNGSYTAGSNSIQGEGRKVRQAAADARYELLQKAAVLWGADASELHVVDGLVSDGIRHATYWELLDGGVFEQGVTEVGTLKQSDDYEVVGQSVGRLNLINIVTGQPHFIHDLDVPDMAHGRVVRPPRYGARLVSQPNVEDMPGVLHVLRDGCYLGVIADREEQAVKAADVLREKSVWEGGRELPDEKALFDHLMDDPYQQALLVVEGKPVDDAVPEIVVPEGARHTVEATYYRPYHMHGSLGPSAAMAHWEEDLLTVWAHTQGVSPLRGSLAQVLDLPDQSVRVIHVEGAGCYGHNGADDAALDAALLARALPGRPVMLKWMRDDEHAWEPYGSCMAVKMQGCVGDGGVVIDWNHDAWSYTHSGRPRAMSGTSNMLGAWHLEKPMQPPVAKPGGGFHGGIHRNADPLYNFRRRRIVKHFVPDSPLRVSALRGLGSPGNVFAIESFMNELAFAAGEDPVLFRIKHLDDERAKDVIRAAAKEAGWQPGVRGKETGRGQGLGFARYKNEKCYVAVIFDVRVDESTGQIDLERAVIAADAGQVVNPDGLKNQLEGGVVQAASWAMMEAVRFDRKRITSRDWETYPILKFPDVPVVETLLIDRPGLPSLGSGEATQGPTPAAIANAVFDAVGIRLRQMPFTADRVLAALN
jgi:CO/xanthine dehydrogenase Mo-binding subunit